NRRSRPNPTPSVFKRQTAKPSVENDCRNSLRQRSYSSEACSSVASPRTVVLFFRKQQRRGLKSAPQRCPDFALVDGNAPVQQVAAVVVPVGEGNAEEPWGRQRACPQR